MQECTGLWSSSKNSLHREYNAAIQKGVTYCAKVVAQLSLKARILRLVSLRVHRGASQLPPPRSGIHDKREDEVVFRAHASRFALFSNPKVLKRSRSINPFLCWHFFQLVHFNLDYFLNPTIFLPILKKGGWKSTSTVLESSKLQSDWKAAERASQHSKKCSDKSKHNFILLRFSLLAFVEGFLFMSAMFSFHCCVALKSMKWA